MNDLNFIFELPCYINCSTILETIASKMQMFSTSVKHKFLWLIFSNLKYDQKVPTLHQKVSELNLWRSFKRMKYISKKCKWFWFHAWTALLHVPIDFRKNCIKIKLANVEHICENVRHSLHNIFLWRIFSYSE